MVGISTFFTIITSIAIVFIYCDPLGKPAEERSSDPCSELAGIAYKPTTLGKLLCVAKDENNIVYVVDKKGSNFRFFYSRGDTLYRRKVLGRGVIGGVDHSLSIDSMAFSRIVFWHSNGKWGSVKSCQSRKQKDCSELSVIDTIDISNFTIRNFPATTHVEYLALLDDGNYILVTRSYYDWDGTVVVHFGYPGTMESRSVIRFIRASDGGSTWIRFKIGSDEVEAVFRVKLTTSGFTHGPAYLLMHGDSLDFERLTPSKEALRTIGFDCHHNFQ